MEPLDTAREKESQWVLDLTKRQKAMLGESLVNLDLFLYLHKSISLLHLEDIHPILLAKLPFILSVRFFSLFLYDPNHDELRLTCSNHLNTDDPLTLRVRESRVMLDALEQKRYIFEPDFTQSKYFMGKKNSLFKNNFFLCVPLMIENQIVGVINLNDSEKGSLSAADLDYILNVLEFVALSVSNALLHEKTEVLSITDGLTQLYDHRQMIKVLEVEFDRCRRYDMPLSLLMLDIDNFKKVNDTYGHQKGDEVLVSLAGVLSRLSRISDTPSRYGGEEFVMILPQTPSAGAWIIAERIRSEMGEQQFESEQGVFSVTISCGVSQLNLSVMKSPADLIHHADKALYQAKEQGRDRTVLGA